jgi:hypothetical protein
MKMWDSSMQQRSIPVSSPALVTALTIALAAAGCGGKRPAAKTMEFKMGERAEVGYLIYNVIHAEWKNELAGEQGPRTPQHRYLLVRLSVTNSGGSEAALPLLQLEDGAGKTYLEVNSGDGVAEWLGLLRTIRPVETMQGVILFDVPPAAYMLHLTDGGEPGQEKLAKVAIPLEILADPAVTEPPAVVGR